MDHRSKLSSLGIPFEIALLSEADNASVVFFKNRRSNTSSGNSMFLENSPDPELQNDFEKTHMNTVTIDSLVNKHELGKVDFLKLDLQGGELLALKGARSTLQSVEVIQTEIHMVNYNQGAPPFLELYTFLDSAGFALYDLGEVQKFEVRKRVHEEVRSVDKVIGVDVIFVKKSSRWWDESCTLFPTPLHIRME